MTYTMDDVDAALRVILGEGLYEALRRGVSPGRTGMMDMAARKCWTDERPEDEHTATLRAALRHLNSTGVILPEDVRDLRPSKGGDQS